MTKRIVPTVPSMPEGAIPIGFVSIVLVTDGGKTGYLTRHAGPEWHLLGALEVAKLDLYRKKREREAQ